MHYLWNRQEEDVTEPLSPEEDEIRRNYRENPDRFSATGESIFTEKRLRRMASEWANKVGTTTRDGHALLGPRYTEVMYETLLERPEEEAARLFGFLGVDASPETTARCVEVNSFERRSKGRARGEEDATSIRARKGVAGDWKRVFTERDKQIFKKAAGEVLIAMGYEHGDEW